jgi:hypothetical protein
MRPLYPAKSGEDECRTAEAAGTIEEVELGRIRLQRIAWRSSLTVCQTGEVRRCAGCISAMVAKRKYSAPGRALMVAAGITGEGKGGEGKVSAPFGCRKTGVSAGKPVSDLFFPCASAVVLRSRPLFRAAPWQRQQVAPKAAVARPHHWRRSTATRRWAGHRAEAGPAPHPAVPVKGGWPAQGNGARTAHAPGQRASRGLLVNALLPRAALAGRPLRRR